MKRTNLNRTPQKVENAITQIRLRYLGCINVWIPGPILWRSDPINFSTLRTDRRSDPNNYRFVIISLQNKHQIWGGAPPKLDCYLAIYVLTSHNTLLSVGVQLSRRQLWIHCWRRTASRGNRCTFHPLDVPFAQFNAERFGIFNGTG